MADPVTKATSSNQAIVREAKISARFAHPNVLPTLGIARMLDSVAVVSPWMRNGNVSDYLSRNPTADRLQLVNSWFTESSPAAELMHVNS